MLSIKEARKMGQEKTKEIFGADYCISHKELSCDAWSVSGNIMEYFVGIDDDEPEPRDNKIRTDHTPFDHEVWMDIDLLNGAVEVKSISSHVKEKQREAKSKETKEIPGQES